jgi:alpha-beta hydrolase superfamily lysophospholipase
MCPKCGQQMADGEVVVMDWAGNAVQHVNCPDSGLVQLSAGMCEAAERLDHAEHYRTQRHRYI